MDKEMRGFKSRKLWMAFIVMFVMTLGFLMVGIWAALAVVYPEFIMGILAASSIYTGSNILSRWADAKSSALVSGKKTE